MSNGGLVAPAAASTGPYAGDDANLSAGIRRALPPTLTAIDWQSKKGK